MNMRPEGWPLAIVCGIALVLFTYVLDHLENWRSKK